jgi:hypothetical protein
VKGSNMVESKNKKPSRFGVRDAQAFPSVQAMLLTMASSLVCGVLGAWGYESYIRKPPPDPGEAAAQGAPAGKRLAVIKADDGVEAPPTPAEEARTLKFRVEFIDRQLDSVRDQLNELVKKTEAAEKANPKPAAATETKPGDPKPENPKAKSDSSDAKAGAKATDGG